MHKFSIVRSPLAKADIRSIFLIIAEHSPAAATQIVERIDRRIRQLADFPELGPERPDLAPGLRFLVEGNYLVLYRLAENRIEIVRVIHGARDLTALF